MTTHTDQIFLLFRVPLKSSQSKISICYLATYWSYCQHFLSTTVITQPWWFLPSFTTSMQTVGVIALCFLSLADLTVTAMFRKI